MAEPWKARLLPGSWRGIPFLIESHELRGGRHAIDHNAPDRKENFAEDIGRKSKRFDVVAHVLGDNYFFVRDALINAMEEPGKGTLIHPYLGIKELQPDGYILREDTKEGRIAFITMSFIEAGRPSFPFSAIDSVTRFLTNVVALVAQVKNAYLLAFKIAELPAFAKDSASIFLGDFVSSYKLNMERVKNNDDSQARLIEQANQVDAQKEVLLDNPASLIEEIDTLIAGLSDLVPANEINPAPTIDDTSGRDDSLFVYEGLINFRNGVDDIPETTPTRIAQKLSLQAFADAINQLAIIRLAEAIVEKEFKTINDAIEKRNELADYINRELIKENLDDGVYQGFSDLLSSVVALVPQQNATFASVKKVTLPTPKPSLVIAYSLFGSIDSELDLIERNRVRNPGFIAGTIEVLNA